MELEPFLALVVGFSTLILGLFQYLQSFLKKYEKLLDTNDKIQDARTNQEIENLKLKYELDKLKRELQHTKSKYAECRHMNMKLRAAVQKYSILVELDRTKKTDAEVVETAPD